MKIESFDQAHAGRCPGCGMMDKEKNHWTHRYMKDPFRHPGGQWDMEYGPGLEKALHKDLGLPYLPGIAELSKE